MNEITKIHLGRQAFTIAVDAHKELQEYLHAIKRHMGNTDEAVEEVELRMAELLAERGVTGDKVVLSKDVEYLKQQLGKPGDFGEAEDKEAPEDTNAPKRLYRDTDDALIAGVASGLGKYFGLDPIWFRLAFIALLFAGGSSILIYIILWLLVPEAKTKSDRLQMQGKPVTVEALKEVVERADVESAAKRATNVVGKVVRTVLKVLAQIVGIILIVAGVLATMALLTAGTYLIAHGSTVNNEVVFPVGAQEVAVVAFAISAAVIVSVLIAFVGAALAKGRQVLSGWAAAILLVLLVVAGSVGTALALDAVPSISKRVDAIKAQGVTAEQICDENIFSHCSYYVDIDMNDSQ